MTVTVGIKAFNEERHIEAAVASACRAVQPLGGEVVLADSGSTDRTIEIARRYKVRIAQLARPLERSCGAGAQLAFQLARHPFFYLLDGDMVLAPGFLQAGLDYLDRHPDIAAVGGRVVECNVEGEDYTIRAKAKQHWSAGYVDRLDCGGLYRTEPLRQLGYFADQNLHSFEEFDVAARLQGQGWRLARIDHHAVDHHGHTASGYRMLLRRMRSGYSGGPGAVLRAALGQRHFPIVVRRLAHIRHGAVVIAWWLLLVMTVVGSPLVCLVLFVLPIAFLWWRRGSLRLGIYSMASWNVTACGLISGFLHRRRSASRPVDYVELASETPTP